MSVLEKVKTFAAYHAREVRFIIQKGWGRRFERQKRILNEKLRIQRRELATGAQTPPLNLWWKMGRSVETFVCFTFCGKNC